MMKGEEAVGGSAAAACLKISAAAKNMSQNWSCRFNLCGQDTHFRVGLKVFQNQLHVAQNGLRLELPLRTGAPFFLFEQRF